MGEFIIENNTLKAYTGSSEAVRVPDEIEIISKGAFRNNKTVRSVTLPQSVVFIDDRAFSCCTVLKDVSLGNSLRALGQHVFSGCTALESVSVPGSLKSVNYCTFYGCTRLRSVLLHEGTKRISLSAFGKCRSLQRIVLPGSVSEIKRFAFAKCWGLRDVTFLSDQKCEIDTNAFFGSHRDLTFHWPNQNAFREELEAGFIVSGEGTLTRYFGASESIVLPASVNRIAAYALALNQAVRQITAPENVVAAERCAMVSMSSLRSVSFDGVKELGKNCFWACVQLEKVSLPACLEKVGNDCFGQCHSLTELDFGRTAAAFDGRIAPMSYALERCVLPPGVQRIPGGAFYYCRSLRQIALPDSVTEISDGAFAGCVNLIQIVVPEKVAKLDLNVFHNCDSLREIVLRSRETKVYGEAHAHCTASIRYAQNKQPHDGEEAR